MPTVRQGDIVWAEVDDPHGRNRKSRPVVIVTETDEIREDEPVVAIAISTRVEDPLPDHHVRLPWQHDRHPKTGLNKACIAVCDWFVEVRLEDVQSVVGFLPGPTLHRILDRAFGS